MPWWTWDAPWPEFPFQSRSLNTLVVHDVLIDLAEELLGTDDLRIYMGLLTAKYHGQSSGYNRLLHTDYPNHMVVVPRRDQGYQQLETFVYLSDVSASNGATRMVSRRLTGDIPVERHTLDIHEYGHLYDVPGEASGPAGSIVAYRPDVYHRSIDEIKPGSARFMLHVSFRPATSDFGGYQAWPIKGYTPRVVQLRPAGHAAAAGALLHTASRRSLLDRGDAGGGGRPLSGSRHGAVAHGCISSSLTASRSPSVQPRR